jgi:hypothetical protein
MTSKAYKKQIGGSHYQNMVMQPSEFINKNKLPFAEGSAIKYICRHAAKGKGTRYTQSNSLSRNDIGQRLSRHSTQRRIMDRWLQKMEKRK